MALARSAHRGAKETKLAKQSLISATETAWRKWRAFIREKQDDLRRRQADADGLDDLTIGVGAIAEVFRAKLTAAERQEMSTIVETRRQNAQRQAEAQARQTGQPAPDVEQVLADVVQRISDELEGKATRSGMALMYFEGELMEFNHQAIARSTSDDDYLLIASDASRQKQMRVVAVIGVSVMALVIIVLLVFRPFAASGTAPVTTPVAYVGQHTAELWNAETVTIGNVRAAISGASIGYPLLICLSADQQPLATAGTALRVEGMESIRTYRLNADAQSTPRDLVVADCAVTPPKLLRSAGLIGTETSRLLEPTLVEQVMVWGSDTHPAVIPPDRMQVDLLVRDAQNGASTLILADGTRWSATTSTPVDGGLRLSFLVPVAAGSQEAGWEVTQPEGLPGVLPLTLPAPISHAQVVRERVVVRGGTATVVRRDGRSLVSLTLTLTLASGTEELSLLPSDLVVSRDDGVPVTTAQWTPPALTPGVPATVQVDMLLDSRQSTVEVALATYHARVDW